MEIKINKTFLIISLSMLLSTTQAAFSVKVPLEDHNGGHLPKNSINLNENSTPETENWIDVSPIYSSWINNGAMYDCSNWSPDPSTVTINESFIQTANDCKQDQFRTRQNREQNTTTLVIRNKGSEIIENDTINMLSDRTMIGTMETWVTTTPNYGSWTDIGPIYGCSNWTPDPSTVNAGQSFPQTANDCEQNQERSVQNREIEQTTNNIRNIGPETTENRIVENVTNNRLSTGTKPVQECIGTWVVGNWGITISWPNPPAVFGTTIASGLTPVNRTSYSTGGYNYTRSTYTGETVCGMESNAPVYCSNYTACRI